MTLELRRSPRVPLGQGVEFWTEGPDGPVVGTGRAKDISIGGTFIETDAPFPPGTEVVVHLVLPERRRAMDLPAIVRWTARDGIGVQFGLLGARETHEITLFVVSVSSGRLRR
jgi:type IV pilus assembly protein PilZ